MLLIFPPRFTNKPFLTQKGRVCDSPFWPNLFCIPLLKPRSKVVACPEIVEQQTNPTCSQNYNCSNQLTDKADRLLQDVNYTPDRAD